MGGFQRSAVCERKENGRHEDFSSFNNFNKDNMLMDLPLGGQLYALYQGDSRSMSWLDRFLLSEDWRLTWPNCVKMAQIRGLLDHCAIMLYVDEVNWGPRSMCMLKCWSDILGYTQFVC